MHCVKFLVEQRNVEINQKDHRRGWTPLMRVAHMAHHTELPYLAVFEYLLQQGADAGIAGQAITITGVVSGPGFYACAISSHADSGASVSHAAAAALFCMHDLATSMCRGRHRGECMDTMHRRAGC